MQGAQHVTEIRGQRAGSWRAAGCAGVLTPGPGESQGALGSSLLVLESRRVCWGPHSWSWRAAGCAGVLTPGPGEPQGVLGSSLLVLNPGPGEPQGVLAFVVTQQLITQLTQLTWFLGSESVADFTVKTKTHPAALQDQGCRHLT